MTTVQDIYRFIDQVAPFVIQESWDNAGMLVGHWKRPVQKILVTLDITPEVVYEAEKVGADLIVAHHPILFHPAKQVTDGGMDLVGQRVLALAERGICCHTNWDSAQGGVNYVLAKLCGLEKQQILEVSGTDEQGVPYGIGRMGTLPLPVALEDYLKLLQGSLEPNGLRYVDGGKPVRRVAVGGGSCADGMHEAQVAVGGGACGGMLEQVAKAGCDTFVTGDVKYDQFLDAKMLGINLIDAGHYPTEDPSMLVLGYQLAKAFPEVTVQKSKLHREVIQYQV